MFSLSEPEKRAIEEVLTERFPDEIERIVFVTESGILDEDVIEIRVVMKEGTRPSDVAQRLYGLTTLVRNALGTAMDHVFPLVRPMGYTPREDCARH